MRQVSVRAMVLEHGNIMMAKVKANEFEFGSEIGKWSLPGGLMDRNEDLYQAVLREVHVQSGWSIKNIRLYCINIYTDEDDAEPQDLELIFISDAVEQTRLPENMSNELRWFPLKTLPKKEDMVTDHVDAIYSLAEMLHGGKTLNLDLLPPVFTKRRSRQGLPQLMPSI